MSDASVLIPWGGLLLPDKAMEAHSLIIGSPKSGKTVMLRMLMRAALLDFTGRLRVRALVYDGKRELYPLLVGMGVSPEQIHLMLPTDTRSTAWNIAADVQTLEHARTLAESLVPNIGKSDADNFFNKACRDVLATVCWSLHLENPGEWTLHELLGALRDQAQIASWLGKTADGRSTYETYFKEPRTGAGVMSSIRLSVVAAYETIALLWRKTARRISLTQWAKEPASGVLMITPDITSVSVTAINQAMFQFAAQQLDARSDLTPEQAREGHETWMFLDEFRFASKFNRLIDLLGKGRSKGIRIAMAAQSIEGVVDVYGEHQTYEMVNNASNLAVLRMSTSPAADKVAKMFGRHETWEEDYSESEAKSYKPGFLQWRWDSKSKTTSRSVKRAMKDNVLSSTLLGFPSAGPDDGIHGIFATPAIGTWQGPIDWRFVEQWLRDKHPETPEYIPRAVHDYYPPQLGDAVKKDEEAKGPDTKPADPGTEKPPNPAPPSDPAPPPKPLPPLRSEEP